ncbi:MAG: hypothetical protein J0I79_22855 [Mesorhizobium sp.]|uniref:hypothetical protein n=1 Tax=Mesorhizobium sp. TaxID=1871066 RepID=UPI001ACC851D|nr:hypothetical protein [Mesorhizobium sp.]MBN9220796.1 hypothetical protein [Mesorhizobium sp.]
MKRFFGAVPGAAPGRHPDKDYRVESLLPGRSTTTPASYLVGAALALLLAVLAPVIVLLVGHPPVGSGAATAVVVFLIVFTLLMSAIAIISGRKGMRWRGARRDYSLATGRQDLGYFGVWDGRGELTDEEVVRQAEEQVRINSGGPSA